MTSTKDSSAVIISDFLGTTLGVVKHEEFIPMPMTGFGDREPGTVNREPGFKGPVLSKVEGFFTGKPYDPDLKAYTFLFRNYRPELGRWTKPDPAGFPDGANNMLYVLNSPLIYLDDTGLARLVNNSSYPVWIAFGPPGGAIGLYQVNSGQIIGTQGEDDGFDGIYNPLDDPNKPGSPATFNDAPVDSVVRKFNDYANITIINAYDPTGKPSVMYYHNTDISANADALDLLIGRTGWKDGAWVKINQWPSQPCE